MGYYDTATPPVILRNVLREPGLVHRRTRPTRRRSPRAGSRRCSTSRPWSCDLTGLPIANASLLDEATAAAEAMHLCHAVGDGRRRQRLLRRPTQCHPQTIDVVQTRAEPLGIEGDRRRPPHLRLRRRSASACWCSTRPPTARVVDYRAFIEKAHAAGALVVVATRPARAHAADAPGRARRRRRGRQRPALRRAAGLRRPARRLLRHQAGVRAPDARPHHRRVAGRATASRRCAWRCRRASSTSAARRRRATSAPRRCCWR